MSDRTKLTVTPDQPISPEEDPKLQAIEAMEVKSTDLDAPKPPVTPPISPKPVAPKQAPLATPSPAKPVSEPVVEVEKPKPLSPSEAIDDVIAHSPALHTGFHPFRNQTRSRKALIIIAGVVILVGIAAGGYVTIQTLGRS